MAFVEGYDVETAQEISSDLFCVICLKLMRNPVQFKCGHGMCYVCFKSLLHRSKQKATTQCPQCREVVKEGQIVSNVMLHRIILSLQVLCGNHDNGCKWSGELDRFDEHFGQCTKHSESSASRKSKKKKKKTDTSQHQPSQNVQNELLLQITEQLSNLKEYIISPSSSSAKTEQKSDPDTSKPSEAASSGKASFLTGYNKSVTASRKTKTLALFLFTISLLSGMHLLSGGAPFWFSSQDNAANQTVGIDHVTTYQQVYGELAKMNSLIYAQQNNFFQLHLGSKELQSDLETQKMSAIRLLGLYMKNSLNAAHFTKTAIADDVDYVFSQEMMHRKLGLERTAGFQLLNIKEDAYARLNLLQNQSLATLTVFNASDFLTPFLKDCKTFQRDFSQQIFISMTTSENLVTHSFQQARRKMAFYVAKENDFTGFDYEDVKKHLVEEREKSDVIFREKLSETKQEEYIRMLRQEYKALNQTYHELLHKSISQYELDSSYQSRSAFVFSRLENIDLQNGRYLWRMNSSLLPLLLTGHGYYSEKFTAIEAKSPLQPTTDAKLWLLRTSVKDNLWKVTYEQHGDATVNLKIAVVNQLVDKDLECGEAFRQRNEKNELVVDFDIPFSLEELEVKGYVQDEKILIKASVMEIN